MPAKLQFQFVGADVNLANSSSRKWVIAGIVSFGLLLLALAGWQYFNHRAQAQISTVALAHSAPVAATVVAPVTTSTSPSLKETAKDSLVALGSSLLQAAKTTAPTPAATVSVASSATPAPVAAVPVAAVPVAPAVTEPVSTPGVQITRVAPVRRAPRMHTEPELLQIAGLTAFESVMALADKYPDAYGFQAGDFLSDAKMGEAIPVYSIDEAARANYKSGQPVKPLLKPCNRWVFPVTLNGRLCCMVQVKKTDKEFVPGTGSKSLAMAWAKIQENWPAEKGYHPQLVVNPQIPGYYFTVPELPMPNMTDTVMMTYFNPCTSPADVILASWR